jgi:hypothetical protein
MLMLANVRLLAPIVTVVAALALMSGDGPALAFQPFSVREDIEEVVKLLQQKKVDRAALAKKVAAIKGKYGVDDLMAKVYKPTKRDGIGYDPAKRGPGDGIEKRIIDLGTKKELTPAQLQAEKKLLLRVVSYNLAMVEIAKAYVPAKPAGAQNRWNRFNGEVGDGTKEMIKAVKANDPKALKKAMGKIAAGCNGCHTAFRN